MRARVITVVVGAAAAAAAALMFVLLPGDSSKTPSATPSAAGAELIVAPAAPAHVRSAREVCSGRSEANFPGAFTDSRNLVVGPLVLVGGRATPAETVREFGGNKFPLLVKAGHIVTVRLAEPGRTHAGLAYGLLPQGRELKLRDAYGSVTFVACRPGRPSRRYRPNGPSGSYADGVAVTFWSGFVLARAPACIPLDVSVDGEPSPRRVGLPLGRGC